MWIPRRVPGGLIVVCAIKELPSCCCTDDSYVKPYYNNYDLTFKRQLGASPGIYFRGFDQSDPAMQVALAVASLYHEHWPQ